MEDSLSAIITLFSYVTGAWIAFKIFDFRTKGKVTQLKHDLLLWPLLLVFALGGGTLLAYILKSWLDVE